jgi:outer membrane murein-binding lipoprotein Lpp
MRGMGNIVIALAMGGIVVIALALGGCASAARVERSAQRHQEHAQELAARGDTAGASKEQQAADKQWSKANSRRGFENTIPIAFH